jgi:hypothetical protein
MAGATFGLPASFRRRIDLRRTHPTRPWVRCWDQRRGPFGVPVVFKEGSRLAGLRGRAPAPGAWRGAGGRAGTSPVVHREAEQEDRIQPSIWGDDLSPSRSPPGAQRAQAPSEPRPRLTGWHGAVHPGRVTVTGPSLVMFSATLQSTCTRATSIEAVANVGRGDDERVTNRLGAGWDQVWVRLAKVSDPMLPPVSVPIPGREPDAARSAAPKPCEKTSI